MTKQGRTGLQRVGRASADVESHRLLAVFSGDDPNLALVKCWNCHRVHTHRMPVAKPSYRKAPCSTLGRPVFYIVVPATLAHARRIFPPLPAGMCAADCLEICDTR